MTIEDVKTSDDQTSTAVVEESTSAAVAEEPTSEEAPMKEGQPKSAAERLPLPEEVKETPPTIAIPDNHDDHSAVRETLMACDTVTDYQLFIKTFGVEKLMELTLNMMEQKQDITPAAKARMMAALWIENQYADFDKLMFDLQGYFSTSELFKLIPLMDRPRRLRQIRRKLEGKGGDKIKFRKRKQIIIEIQEMQREIHAGSITSSFTRRVKKWVGTLPEETLTFQAVNFPTDNWRATADLCHLRPDDFQLPWFLPLCFGAPAPEGTLVATMMSMTTETLASNLKAFPYLADCFSMLRQKVGDGKLELTEEVRTLLAEMAPLEDVLWFYEEIVVLSGGSGLLRSADDALHKRLAAGESLSHRSLQGRINYPKLMERIMLLESHSSACVEILMERAQEMLDLIKFPENDLKVAVFGDSSYSMDIAVKGATIIASILTAKLNAELSFFYEEVFMPPKQPTTARDVLEVAKAVELKWCTSPAACLYPYYEQKKHVDLFLMVTDEEENTENHDYMFTPLFQKYLAEVNKNAKLFFVSFLKVGDPGQMVTELREVDVVARQFRFDLVRPDLGKFEELLGLLTLQILDDKEAMEQVKRRKKGTLASEEADSDGGKKLSSTSVQEAEVVANVVDAAAASADEKEWVQVSPAAES